MPFTKMHGLGNDYVFVDCLDVSLAGVDIPALARATSDRHRGVGSDGLILICPPDDGVEAHARMEVYNADGSRAEMCGNGIRCVAKYVIESGIASGKCVADRRAVRIQTDRGVRALEAYLSNGLVQRVRVDMGRPILEPGKIPVDVPGDRCVRVPLSVGGASYVTTCVSMGNPHAVVFVPDPDAIDLAALGRQVEHLPLFPNRVNLHLAGVQSRQSAVMRTWERGSGLTMACGTGACAVLVAGVLEGRLDRAATIRLPGGDLSIEWVQESSEASAVCMTGPAVEVFRGEWPT
ncbi:MAG: diaminopimelate epimerase [Planctomycetota bacterium]